MTLKLTDARLDVYKPDNWALEYDGVNDTVGTGLTYTGEQAYSLTVSFWLTPQAGGHTHGRQVDADLGRYWGFRDRRDLDPDRFEWRAEEPGGTVRLIRVNKPPDDEAVFVTGVIDLAADRLRLYFDAQQVGSTSFPAAAWGNTGGPTRQVQFMANSDGTADGGTNIAAGILDEVRVDHRVLSDAEILALYEGRTGDVADTDLAGYWRHNGGPGSPNLADSGPNNLDGTIFNSPEWRVGIARDDVVRPPAFEFLDVASRLQNLVDQTRIDVRNDAGEFSGRITSGDRLRFHVQREGEAVTDHKWTGMARNVTYTETGAGNTDLHLSADDYVFGILDTRTVTNSYEDRVLAREPDGILNDILDDNAPEIDRSLISDVTETTSMVFNGLSLLEAVSDIADRADAAVWADEDRLGFMPVADATQSFTLRPRDRGLARVTENDDNMVNRLRVNGGEGVEIDVAQEVQDGYVRVTDTNRLTHRIRARKSEYTRIEVWTRRDAASPDNVIVRLQADDGAGNPVAPANRESDIAAKTLAPDFLETDGFTTFLMPNHTLPDRDPHLLVEATGPDGHDIGVNTATGVPTFRAYFPFPLDTVLPVQASIREFGRRERVVRRDDLKKRQQVIDFARAYVRHTDEPDREMSFPAESVRAHDLAPGDVIGVDNRELNAVGEFIVVETSHTYESSNLDTEVTLQEVNTL